MKTVIRMHWYILCVFILLFASCNTARQSGKNNRGDDLYNIKPVKLKKSVPSFEINTGKVSVDELMEFSQTLIGVKYCYGSTDIKKGFDCSGFVWYVYNHFGIKTPRTSHDFTNVGKEVTLAKSRKGDLILFTGFDKNSGIVGHVGMILDNINNQVKFIHAASGNNIGVTVSTMSTYYRERFVKVNRVFF